jgi:hypothetical protein
MKKYYITNEINQFNLGTDLEGKTIVFEMPSFCSGDYEAKIYKDEIGFYIKHSNHGYFKGCRDFNVVDKSIPPSTSSDDDDLNLFHINTLQ